MGLLDKALMALVPQGTTTAPSQPQGLLGFLSSPVGQGLMGAAFGTAASYGRGRGLFGNLGAGGLSGMQAYAGAQEQERTNAERARVGQIQDFQFKQQQEAAAREEAIRKAAQRNYNPGAPGMGGLNSSLPPEMQVPTVPGRAPAFNTQGFMGDLFQIDPVKALEYQSKLKPKVNTTPQVMRDPRTNQLVNVLVGEDGTTQVLPFGVKPDVQMMDTGGGFYAVDKNAVQGGYTLPKTGNPYSDLVLGDGQGGFRPNVPLVNTKQGIARAGAPQVNVNTDKSYFGNVAEGMAKLDVSAIEAGRSGPDRIASARRVKEVLAANPITGTGADERLAIEKAFATAGLIDPSRANATEALATELAAQTLDSIKTSGLGSGQGFTDKDRAFLQDARSGRIQMTPANIERIADLNERSAVQSIRRANSVIQRLRGSPQAGAMGKNLDPIPEPEAPAQSSPTGGQSFAQMPRPGADNKGRFLTDKVTGRRFQSNGMSWVEVDAK